MPAPDSLRGLANSIEELARNHPRWSQIHDLVLVLTGSICAISRVAEVNQSEALAHQELTFDYVNYRGEKGVRKVRPLTIRWGTSDWYKTPQWLLMCWDLDKNDMREFAIANMSNVQQQDHQ